MLFILQLCTHYPRYWPKTNQFFAFFLKICTLVMCLYTLLGLLKSLEHFTCIKMCLVPQYNIYIFTKNQFRKQKFSHRINFIISPVKAENKLLGGQVSQVCLAVRNKLPALDIVTCIAKSLGGFMSTSCFIFSLLYQQCLKISMALTLLK